MANSVSYQVLSEGTRNYQIKITGVLDTSNVAATGTLGASASGATTLGSTTITFTAGGLTPTIGQYVTGTGIPSGAYIVSATTTSAVISAAATATGTGLTFTLTAGNIVVVDPATFLDNYTGQSPITPTTVRIDHVDYSISDQLEVQLAWDATSPQVIMPIAGRGRMSFWNFGGLTNNAGAGKTGRILLQTTGWSSGTQIFSIVLECVKQYT